MIVILCHDFTPISVFFSELGHPELAIIILLLVFGLCSVCNSQDSEKNHL